MPGPRPVIVTSVQFAITSTCYEPVGGAPPPLGAESLLHVRWQVMPASGGVCASLARYEGQLSDESDRDQRGVREDLLRTVGHEPVTAIEAVGAGIVLGNPQLSGFSDENGIEK